jgi:hypothetical protein
MAKWQVVKKGLVQSEVDEQRVCDLEKRMSEVQQR